MQASEILSKAADVIEPEGAWSQNRYAATASGATIGTFEKNAACFCALGAMMRVARGKFRSDVRFNNAVSEAGGFVHQLLQKRDDYRSLVSWNDAPGRTQSEVVAALRQAASLAKQSEAAP